MRPAQVKGYLVAQLDQAKQGIGPEDRLPPLFTWGPPGIGKSQVVQQVSVEAQVGFKRVSAVNLDPTDVRGIPVPEDGSAVWVPPEFLPRADRDGPVGILHWDDVGTAPPQVQAALFRILLEHQMDNYVMPKGWVQVASSNNVEDRALVKRLPSPVANRFIHVDMDVNVEDWTAHAVKASFHPMVIAFIQIHQGLLFQFNPETDTRAFPTPRTHEFLSRLLYAIPEPPLELMSGTVGGAVAAQFMAFMKLRHELPDLNRIMGGDNIIPQRLDILYVTVTALVDMTKEQKHFDRLIRYSLQFPKMATEAAVLLVMLLRNKDAKKVVSSPAWADWATRFKHVIL